MGGWGGGGACKGPVCMGQPKVHFGTTVVGSWEGGGGGGACKGLVCMGQTKVCV